MKKNKRGQITIFIILGLLILIVLFFLFRGNFQIIESKTPILRIEDCVEQGLEIEQLNEQGGSFNPEFYYLYKGDKIQYLCYTDEYYKTCVMQKPLLKQEIEKEINSKINPILSNCVDSVKSDLEKEGYSVRLGNLNSDIKIIPENIVIEISDVLETEKNGKTNYENLKINIPSKLYEMTMIASSISNWEAHYGDSETMNYMIYYPNIKVEKKKQGEGTTIYILTNRLTLDKFQFASRSLVIPPGVTGL